MTSHRSPDDGARLLLGPMLRHVTPTSATFWVEVSRPCRVQVRGDGLDASASTFSVAGHHYALVVARDLLPASNIEYEVLLDGRAVWPEPGWALPASVVRTPAGVGPVTIAFGSCRYASPTALAAQAVSGRPGIGGIGPDALDALARDMIESPGRRPDLLLLLGDQVYADETTSATRALIAERRGERSEPRGQVADYEEYTWLYHESWADPEVRWLFSCIPTAMVFDDHDVHDDWNTSGSWRRDVQAQAWWQERITAALESAWVYQHLGNLSPAELDVEPCYRRLLDLPAGTDAEPLLRELATAADTEADGDKGYRWSYARDLGRTRLVVVDTRCGRVLDGGDRAMISDAHFAWLEERLRGDYDHLVVASSLPWLLAPALHDLEAWNERVAASPGRRRAWLGEQLRRAFDLEHWAAFAASFARLSDLFRRLSRGDLGRPAPGSITVLSGDVHHSYLARVDWAGSGTSVATSAETSLHTSAPVHQITCSPLHQAVARPMRWAFRASWSPPARLVGRWLRRRAGHGDPGFRWHRVGGGPWLGNALGTIVFDGLCARAVVASSEQPPDAGPFRELVRAPLTPTCMITGVRWWSGR